MQSSWPDQVGPELSFSPAALVTDDETTSAGESDGGHVTETDDEWMAWSNDVVEATNHIEQSIEEEAEAHHSRQERTKWELSNEKTDTARSGGGRLLSGKARREHRKLMSVLRKKYQSDTPEMLTEPSTTTTVT